MTYHVVWSKAAAKQLMAIPKRQRMAIAQWIKDNLEGSTNPKAIPGTKKLTGTKDGWRWRVGVYRILGRVDGDNLIIEVVRVGHRQDIYKQLPDL